MSIRIMSRVWDGADASGGTLLVLLALANFADDDGFCWPRIETIAQKARLTTRQVSAIITTLVQTEQIATKPGGGRGNPTKYAVLCGMTDEERIQTLKKLHGNPLKTPKNLQGLGVETPKNLQGLPQKTLKPRNFFSESAIAESGSVTPDHDQIRHGGDPSWIHDPPPPQSGGGGGGEDSTSFDGEPAPTDPPEPLEQPTERAQPDPITVRILREAKVSAVARREVGHVPGWVAERIMADLRTQRGLRSPGGALVAELRAWLAEQTEEESDERRRQPVGSGGGGGRGVEAPGSAPEPELTDEEIAEIGRRAVQKLWPSSVYARG